MRGEAEQGQLPPLLPAASLTVNTLEKIPTGKLAEVFIPGDGKAPYALIYPKWAEKQGQDPCRESQARGQAELGHLLTALCALQP